MRICVRACSCVWCVLISSFTHSWNVPRWYAYAHTYICTCVCARGERARACYTDTHYVLHEQKCVRNVFIQKHITLANPTRSSSGRTSASDSASRRNWHSSSPSSNSSFKSPRALRAGVDVDLPMCVIVCERTNIHTYIYRHKHMYIYTHTHIHAHTYSYTYIHTCI